jgi:hypothetical protein
VCDQSQACAAQKGVGLPLNSKLELEALEHMKAPVHIYYILTDFFQNYIRYVRSVSYDQLHGKDKATLSDCIPQNVLAVDEASLASLVDGGTINPCGLTAWSFFNDTFTNFEVSTWFCNAMLSSLCLPCFVLFCYTLVNSADTG